jgi:hypothetical protein
MTEYGCVQVLEAGSFFSVTDNGTEVEEAGLPIPGAALPADKR